MEEKLPPQNADAEAGALGSIQIAPEAIAELAEFLTADDFDNYRHGLIYQAALDLYEDRGPVDLITLVDELQRRGQLEEIGGISYLTSLSNQVPTSRNVAAYGRIIKRTANNRRWAKAGTDLFALAHDDPDDATMLAHAENLVADMRRRMPSIVGDPLRPRSLAEMLDEPAPELLIDRLLMEHGVSMIAGDGGSGKSLLLADLCIHIALGREWNGHQVKQGAVLVVAGEGGQGFAWRVKAWLEHYGMSLDNLTNFYIIPHAVQVLDDAQRARVVAYAKALPEPVAFVAIETLSQTAGGADQDNNGEMAAYVRCCREIATALEAHVTFTHHALKNGNGYRGASALKDDSDTTILVTRDGDTSTVHCEKQRDGWEYFPDFTFTGSYVSPEGANGLSYGVFEYTGLKERTERSGRSERAKPPSDARRYVLEAIAQRPGITRAQIKAYLLNGYKISKTSAYRTINEMIGDGWISEEMDGLVILPACPNLSQFVPTGQSGLSLVRPILSHSPLGVGQVGQTGQSDLVGTIQ